MSLYVFLFVFYVLLLNIIALIFFSFLTEFARISLCFLSKEIDFPIDSTINKILICTNYYLKSIWGFSLLFVYIDSVIVIVMFGLVVFFFLFSFVFHCL